MPHTPRPWQAKLGRSMAFDVSIVNEEGHIVARTSESNGPLIAAAPDLLDALRLALPYVEDAAKDALRVANNTHPDRDDDNLHAWATTICAALEKGRTALAKAMEQPR